jgi:DNA repair exonuclease SbcCD nuclease subunit
MPGEPGAFTFLQVSDVHLASKLASLRLSLPVAKRHERNKEILNAFLKCLALAQERKVDAVLIPGDLWDSEAVSSQTLNRIIEALDGLGSLPVVIAPGNHDYCSADSLYNPDVLAARGMRPWPANVHVFQTGNFETWRHPQRSDVSFTGRAFTGNTLVSERLLAGPVPRDQAAAVNILLFHGSLDGYSGGDSGWPGKITAPFSAGEVAKLGFTYAAVGHYHDYTEIRSEKGDLLGAYSGCLAGRGLDECGPRYALLGTVYPDGRCELERIEFDNRRVVSISCDITGSKSTEVMADVTQFLSDAGARTQLDIAFVTLEGRHPVGGEPTYVEESLADSYYHTVIIDRSRPDYLTERFDKRTTEGRFIQAMLELKKEAIEAGGHLIDNSYDSELTTELIEDALYYGLDALKQKKVVVRNVD